MFYSGMKVVCVNARTIYVGPYVLGAVGLKEGTVYTVAWPPREDGDGHVIIGVMELGDQPRLAVRSRPASDRPTSIEIFKSLLNPSPETVALGEEA